MHINSWKKVLCVQVQLQKLASATTEKNGFIICSAIAVYCKNHTPSTDYSEHTRQAQSTQSVVSGPVISICSPLSDHLEKYDTRPLAGEARKTLSLSLVSAVWEKSIKVSMLNSSIFYCVNLIPSHGERKMSGWFEGKRWGSLRRRRWRGKGS